MPSGEIFQRLVIKMAVGRVWKGDLSNEVTMFTSEIHLPDGNIRIFGEDFIFEDEKAYLIYAWQTRAPFN